VIPLTRLEYRWVGLTRSLHLAQELTASTKSQVTHERRRYQLCSIDYEHTFLLRRIGTIKSSIHACRIPKGKKKHRRTSHGYILILSAVHAKPREERHKRPPRGIYSYRAPSRAKLRKEKRTQKNSHGYLARAERRRYAIVQKAQRPITPKDPNIQKVSEKGVRRRTAAEKCPQKTLD
jgi:hypothetical protein